LFPQNDKMRVVILSDSEGAQSQGRDESRETAADHVICKKEHPVGVLFVVCLE